MIPYGRQNISKEDIDSVVAVLESDYLTQGLKVPEFERAIATKCGAQHGVAANSATSALHIAYLALGIGPSSTVWTSPITFVATTNAALMCGAKVDFVDVDAQTFNMCPKALAEKLAEAKKNGTLPDLVVPVHLSGQSCLMKDIHALSKTYGFKIVEDASHAIGAKYRGNWVGCCEFSEITVFSFHPVKIITTGEGGVALTNDRKLAHRMATLRSHGITRRQEEMSKVADGPWYYEQHHLGFNYRMTDIAAALGISQLLRLDSFVEERRRQAAYYDELLKDTFVKTPFHHKDTSSSLHLYIVRVDSEVRSEIFRRLRDAGVLVNLHYIPVYRHPYYQLQGFRAGDFPDSERYYSEAISLPIFPGLQAADQDYIANKLTSASGQQTLF